MNVFEVKTKKAFKYLILALVEQALTIFTVLHNFVDQITNQLIEKAAD